ncbi:VOC family protein [Seonamhaeicola maritimus]|uniref:VOC family protein n=1 Tax=Seonamhaeicola maritimus TaxID=2591822 RepID=A0A5C7GKA3_9FLAO|nr:VOC family protein [Seonamhaeicola maritimus]TXG38547.1 VOC family protein [Seonamhaeicola maritimus]
MEQRLTIVGLGVKNLDLASDFYENKFGWKKMKSSNDDIKFFQLNGMLLSLYSREKLAEDATVSHEGSGFKGFTLAYNTRTKEEVDELIETLELKGVKIVKRPEEALWGGYSSYVADMDDNLWEIAFNPFLAIDEKGNTIEESE